MGFYLDGRIDCSAIIMTACGYADYAGAAGGHAAYLGAAALAGTASFAFSGYKLGRSYLDRSNLATEMEVVTSREIDHRRDAETILDQAVDMSALVPAITSDGAFNVTPIVAVTNVVGASATQLTATRDTLRMARV